MSWVFLLFDKHFSLIFLIFFVFIFYIALIMKIHFFLSIENWRGGDHSIKRIKTQSKQPFISSVDWNMYLDYVIFFH